MAPTDIDYDALEFLLGKIEDGFLFEDFAKNVLCAIMGTDFVPVGGVKDRGVDGLDHTSFDKNDEKTIYQISIEADPRSKISRTIESLKKNEIAFSRIFYVTNRKIKDQDKLVEAIYAKERVNIICRDVLWLRGNIASTPGARLIYEDFVRKNLHLLPISTPNLIVADYASDPRDPASKTAMEQGDRLSNRLNDHRKNIAKATSTLKLEDFEYRALVVQTGWQTSAEDYLIHLFKPIWNSEVGICHGFGKHGDDPGTRANLRSPWDTLHHRRDWAPRSQHEGRAAGGAGHRGYRRTPREVSSSRLNR
jgi:hypothetical protein